MYRVPLSFRGKKAVRISRKSRPVYLQTRGPLINLRELIHQVPQRPYLPWRGRQTKTNDAGDFIKKETRPTIVGLRFAPAEPF